MIILKKEENILKILLPLKFLCVLEGNEHNEL